MSSTGGSKESLIPAISTSYTCGLQSGRNLSTLPAARSVRSLATALTAKS